MTLRSLALSKFPEVPVLELINELTDSVTKRDVESAYGRIMIVNRIFTSIEKLGKGFISASAGPLSK